MISIHSRFLKFKWNALLTAVSHWVYAIWSKVIVFAFTAFIFGNVSSSTFVFFVGMYGVCQVLIGVLGGALGAVALSGGSVNIPLKQALVAATCALVMLFVFAMFYSNSSISHPQVALTCLLCCALVLKQRLVGVFLRFKPQILMGLSFFNLIVIGTALYLWVLSGCDPTSCISLNQPEFILNLVLATGVIDLPLLLLFHKRFYGVKGSSNIQHDRMVQGWSSLLKIILCVSGIQIGLQIILVLSKAINIEDAEIVAMSYQVRGLFLFFISGVTTVIVKYFSINGNQTIGVHASRFVVLLSVVINLFLTIVALLLATFMVYSDTITIQSESDFRLLLIVVASTGYIAGIAVVNAVLFGSHRYHASGTYTLLCGLSLVCCTAFVSDLQFGFTVSIVVGLVCNLVGYVFLVTSSVKR